MIFVVFGCCFNTHPACNHLGEKDRTHCAQVLPHPQQREQSPERVSISAEGPERSHHSSRVQLPPVTSPRACLQQIPDLATVRGPNASTKKGFQNGRSVMLFQKQTLGSRGEGILLGRETGETSGEPYQISYISLLFLVVLVVFGGLYIILLSLMI